MAGQAGRQFFEASPGREGPLWVRAVPSPPWPPCEVPPPPLLPVMRLTRLCSAPGVRVLPPLPRADSGPASCAWEALTPASHTTMLEERYSTRPFNAGHILWRSLPGTEAESWDMQSMQAGSSLPGVAILKNTCATLHGRCALLRHHARRNGKVPQNAWAGVTHQTGGSDHSLEWA